MTKSAVAEGTSLTAGGVSTSVTLGAEPSTFHTVVHGVLSGPAAPPWPRTSIECRPTAKPDRDSTPEAASKPVTLRRSSHVTAPSTRTSAVDCAVNGMGDEFSYTVTATVSVSLAVVRGMSSDTVVSTSTCARRAASSAQAPTSTIGPLSRE